MDSDKGHNWRSDPTSWRSNTISQSLCTRIDAETLLGSGREVILTLHGTEYRLRLTSKGKLILTK